MSLRSLTVSANTAFTSGEAADTSVEVSGLSEGTRDQLFLSLRIAAIELQLKHKRPLPFIADDLFSTSMTLGLEPAWRLSATSHA